MEKRIHHWASSAVEGMLDEGSCDKWSVSVCGMFCNFLFVLFVSNMCTSRAWIHVGRKDCPIENLAEDRMYASRFLNISLDWLIQVIWSCCVSLILPQWLCTPRSSRVLKGWSLSLYFYSVQGWPFSYFFHPFKNSGNHMSWSLQFEYRIISYLLQTLRDDDDPSVTAISPHHNISSNLIAMNTGTDDLLFTSTTSWSWYFFRSLVFQQMQDETIWSYDIWIWMDLMKLGWDLVTLFRPTQKRALNIEFMIPMVSCFRLTWF